MNFETLYNRYKNLVFNLALQYTQNWEDAQEITQDVFVSIHHSLSRFKNAAKLSSWIYRITFNKSLDFIKSQKRKKRWGVLFSTFFDKSNETRFDGANFNHPGRDAVVGERLGFDCAKAHPAMGNYHHHQNPSAFGLDLDVISNVCDLYASDGLYAIDSTQHGPLLGFTYDGFPIYGAYAFRNADGSGGITRMKSSYVLRNITTRNTYANGNTVTAGPLVNATYPLGYFREDYQYNVTSALTPDSLDEHNGRFCVTPEYPNGIYCYFTTVGEGWNSAYPYVVGPTFYGTKTAAKVTSITETVEVFSPLITDLNSFGNAGNNLLTYPNPANDVLGIQWKNINQGNSTIELFDLSGKVVSVSEMKQGSSLAYFDTRNLYNGEYIIRVKIGNEVVVRRISVVH